MLNNNNNLYPNEVGILYKIFKSQLPNSIILTGQDVDIISNIANSFAALLVTNQRFENYNDFKDFLYNSSYQDTQFILNIEPIYLEDKQRFKKKNFQRRY